MTGISRYVLRQLLVGLVLTGLGLASILWLTQSLRFIELIVNKGLSIPGFLWLTVMLLPNLLGYIVPVSLFAVVLFVYNKMITDRELVALRAAGLSQWGLARPAIILATAATVLGYMVSLWVAPISNSAFRDYHWSIRRDLSTLLIQEGSFNHIAPGLTLFVRNRSGADELMDISLYDDRTPGKAVTTMARRGVLVDGPSGPRVVLENGNRQEVTRDTGEMSMLYFDTYSLDFGLANAKNQRNLDARERPLAELLTAQPGKLSETQVREFRVEAHQRLSAPLQHLGFAIIALACLLSGTFNRRGQTGRVFLAIGLLVAAEASALVVANLAVRSTTFLPLLYVNALIPLVAGGYVLLGPPARRLGFLPRQTAPLQG